MSIKYFETEICSRCCGTGEYSYCQSHGTKCFKCLGSKITYTKKGESAYRYYLELCTKPVTEVKVGDKIKSGNCKGFVQSIKEGIQEGSSLKDGVMVPYKTETLCLELKTININLFKTSKVFVYPKTEEEVQALVAKALEYQETLTKQGKPRKSKAK